MPLKLLAAIVPATLKFCKPAILVRFTLAALKVPASIVPVTDKLVNWPMEVMFG